MTTPRRSAAPRACPARCSPRASATSPISTCARQPPTTSAARSERPRAVQSDRQHQARQALGREGVAPDAEGGLATLVLHAAKLREQDAQPVIGGGIEAG